MLFPRKRGSASFSVPTLYAVPSYYHAVGISVISVAVSQCLGESNSYLLNQGLRMQQQQCGRLWQSIVLIAPFRCQSQLLLALCFTYCGTYAYSGHICIQNNPSIFPVSLAFQLAQSSRFYYIFIYAYIAGKKAEAQKKQMIYPRTPHQQLRARVTQNFRASNFYFRSFPFLNFACPCLKFNSCLFSLRVQLSLPYGSPVILLYYIHYM